MPRVTCARELLGGVEGGELDVVVASHVGRATEAVFDAVRRSTSKGFIGECGRRGGFMELYNVDPYVHSQIYKLASSGLCSASAYLCTSTVDLAPVSS